jgi:glycosyltransferase involved in cell wall biosynthesis
VEFNIYGPKESLPYWDECKRLIADLPANVKAVYFGEVEHADVRSVIATHDVFFVPTRGENFGHVFLEALSAGVPLLVSDQTPWRNLKEKSLGWDIALDKPLEFARALEDAARRSGADRAMSRLRCIDFAREISESDDSLEMNRRLFKTALGAAHASISA